jgi:hypothetical protein
MSGILRQWGDLRAYIMAAVNGGASVDVEEQGHSVKVHDFAWHRRHRGQHSVQFVDVLMVIAWLGFIVWMAFHH